VTAGRAVAAVVLLALVAGCGVPLSDRAEPVAGVPRGTASASPSPTGSASEATGSSVGAATLWYVDKTRLVPRRAASASDGPVTGAEALSLLAAVPSGEDGLITLIADPVGGPPVASVPTVSPSPSPSTSAATSQRVLLSPTFSELTADEQVLLIGQVVLTLTELDPAPVVFVDEAGAPLSIPLPDGRLRDGAVTRGDYISLT
jgi:hypothetical protein